MMKRKIWQNLLVLCLVYVLSPYPLVCASIPVETEVPVIASTVDPSTTSEVTAVVEEKEEVETHSSDELAEAKKQLQALQFEETSKTKSTTVRESKSEVAREEELDKIKDEPILQKGLVDESNVQVLVVICIGFGLILGLYTTYMVYQLKKDNKKAHNP